MTPQTRFLMALKRLQDWHAPSTKARDYNSPSSSSTKPGHVVLRVQRYPRARYWMDRWARERDKLAVIADMELEYAELSHRPGVRVTYDFWGKPRFERTSATPKSSRRLEDSASA